MKQVKKIASMIFVIALCVFCGTTAVFAADNATGGDGDTSDSTAGYGWYNGKEYLWKVSLYVGKSDTASTSSNLVNDYYQVGGSHVYLKNTNWSLANGTLFGSKNKVQYFSGAGLSYTTSSPKIIVDSGAPKVPIACGGSVSATKSYFGDTNTVNMILNGMAQMNGTSQEGLISGLNFTIAGNTKTWNPSYILPRVSSGSLQNRVPWVVVYEPVVVAHLKDKSTLLAFTATEFAMAQQNGWYNFRLKGNNPQKIEKLTHQHLPTSVQLEYSWFGYPVFSVTDDSKVWNDQNIIKGGGWGMRFLDGQEIDYVDFSVSEVTVNKSPIYQGDTLQVTVRSDNWNNRKEFTNIPLELLYKGIVIGRQNVDFAPWGLNRTTFVLPVGTNLGAQDITARVNWSNHMSEDNPNNNSASESVNIQKYYDFSVSDLELSKTEEYENRTIKVSCQADNWDKYNAYSNVPVELVYDGQVLATQYVDFDAYDGKIVNYDLQVGSVLGDHDVQVRVNWADRAAEVTAENNITDAQTLHVKEYIDISMEALTPNANYRAGTKVISSFKVYNDSTHHITPGRNMTVQFTAYYYENGVKKTITTQQRQQAIVPSYQKNLIYFKWRVPENLDGKMIYCSATANEPASFGEPDFSNNSASLEWNVIANENSQTPNPDFSVIKPNGWNGGATSLPTTTDTVENSWNEWLFDSANNVFVEKFYYVIADNTAATLTPDVTNKSAYRKSNGEWVVKSGYGVNLSFTPQLLRNCFDSAITGFQRGEAHYPEFNYSTAPGKYSTLGRWGASFQLQPNIDSLMQGRVHFVPVWHQDGRYFVRVQVSDLWTPAGMMQFSTVNDILNIENNMYDDYFTNRQ